MYFRWKEFITLASSAVVGAGLTLIGATSGCLDGIINTSHDDSQQKTVSATFDDTNPAYGIMGTTSSLQDVTDSPDDVKDATEGVRRIHHVLMSSKDSIINPSENKGIFDKIIDVSDSGLTDTITTDSLDVVINEPIDSNLAVITSQAFMQSDVVDERVVVSQEDYKNSFSSDLLSNMTQSETIVSITKLTKDFIEKLNSGELYPNILRVYTYSLLKSMPKGFVPESFIEQYFDEFFPSYLEFVGEKGYFPNTILVTDKSSFTTYLFDLSSENAYRSNGTLRYTKKFKVGTGKQEGKKRSVAGLNKKEKITPEGIFWVDRIVDKPEKVYSNGAYLGPRVISTMAPGERTPNDDIAYHGTTRRTQRTIGSAKSFGCLRMYNPEVVELYDKLDQQKQHGKGTIVIITP